MSAGGAVNGSTGVDADQSCTSEREKGWESGAEAEYSPGRSKKKKASHIRSDAAREDGSSANRAIQEAWWRIVRGMGLTRTGAGSDLE